MSGAALATLLIGFAAQGRGVPPVLVHDVAPPAGERVTGAWLDDLDADGRPDLLVVTAPRDGGRRRLALRRGRAGDARYPAAADAEILLTPDVIALAPGDVHPDPGREVVLWTAGGAFAWRPAAPEPAERFVRLATTPLLWQRADDREVLDWRTGVRDLDGDGLDDLLTPELGGYQPHLQRRADGAVAFAAAPRLEVEEGALIAAVFDRVRVEDPLDRELRDGAPFGVGGVGGAGGPSGTGLELSLGGRAGAQVATSGRALLDHAARMPAPILTDFDGDGAPDCLAQTARELLVWRGWQRGGPAELRLPLPVELDRARRLDLAHATAVGHLDRDGRADVVIFATDKRSEDVRTQVLVYRASAAADGETPLFGAQGRPSQLLVLAGFAGGARLLDVDGDGLDDLVAASVRPDLLSALGGGEVLEIELHVFLSRDGGFARRPELTTALRISADALLGGYAFVGDASGDGVRDLLVQRGDVLELFYVRPGRPGGGGGLERLDRAAWSLPFDEDADLRIERAGGDVRAFVVERDRLRVLEVGR